MYVINPPNTDLGDLTFDSDEKLINRWQIYCINNCINIEQWFDCSRIYEFNVIIIQV